jgi:hypothetical protein
MSNILVFKKIIIVKERGLHFKVLFAKYYKPVHKNNVFGERCRISEVLGKSTNPIGGEL